MRNTAVEHEVTSSWGLSLSTEVLQNEDELTELFLSKARDLTQCEYSSLYWVRKRELEAAGRTGDKGGQRLRMAIADEKILGHVAVTREPVIVTDAYNDARFDPTIDSQTGYRTETVLCMPVVDGDADAIIAVAQMVNKKGGAIFTADDAGRFQALAKQCVVALKACRSYTKVAQRYHNYKAIFDALTQLATTDAADATATNDVLTEGAKTLMSCERASLFVADSERHLLYSKLAQKSHGKQMSSSLNLGLATEVVKTGTLLNVPDAYRDKRFGRDIDGGQRSRTKAILAMPVMYRDEPIGVIQVLDRAQGKGARKSGRRSSHCCWNICHSLTDSRTPAPCPLYIWTVSQGEQGRKHRDSRRAKNPRCTAIELADEHWREVSKAGTSSFAYRPFVACGGVSARRASFWATFDMEPESTLFAWPLSGCGY